MRRRWLFPGRLLRTAVPEARRFRRRSCTPDPVVRRIFIEVDQPATASSSVDGIRQLLLGRFPGWSEFPVEEAASQLARLLADCPAENGATLVCHEQLGVTSVLPGDRPRSPRPGGRPGNYDHSRLSLRSAEWENCCLPQLCSNPQRKFGDDVISRISQCCAK